MQLTRHLVNTLRLYTLTTLLVTLGSLPFVHKTRADIVYETILGTDNPIAGVRGTTTDTSNLNVVFAGSLVTNSTAYGLLYSGPSSGGGTNGLFSTIPGVPNAINVGFYGPNTPAYSGGSNVTAVGTYNLSTGTSGVTYGYLYQGPITTNPANQGTWSLLTAPFTGGETNTVPHSTMGDLVVGCYSQKPLGNPGTLLTGGAFIYSISSSNYINMNVPLGSLSSAYGIWQNGGSNSTSYTIAGSASANEAMLVNFNKNTGTFSNQTLYQINGALVSHFEGITGVSGGFNVVGFALVNGAAQWDFGFIATNGSGEFSTNVDWIPLDFPGSTSITADTVYGNYAYGNYYTNSSHSPEYMFQAEILTNGGLYINSGTYTNNANLIYVTTNTVSVSGGSLVNYGTMITPTLTLSGGYITNEGGAFIQVSNSVTVSGGTLMNIGTITTPTLSVSSGGSYMMMDGVLNGTLNISAGGSFYMDPSTVNGNVTNSGNMIFVSQNVINGNLQLKNSSSVSIGSGSMLVVNGSATLGGTLEIATPMAFGTKQTFLSATSITGTFDSIIAPAGERGRLVIEGDPTASIIIAPASYTQMAANQNQVNVATALNSFIPYTSGDQQVVSTSLDSLTASQYNQAFNAIMPTFYQQVATIAFNEANALNMELNQRLWGLRLAEGRGFSMSGLAENYPMIQEGQGDGGKGVLDAKKDILRPGLDNHWGLFVDGNGIFSQANSANMLPGYNSESGGITTGLTYKWNDKVASGIYAGYQGTYTKSGANGSGLGTGSSLTDNAVRFGVFGTYGNKDGKGLYLNALAGGAYHNYQATRVIQYTGIDRTANSQPGAGELDSMLATGYDIQKGKFTFGPTASLQYTYLGVNSLNETGAQSLNYNSGGWNSSSMLSSVGAHAAYNWVAHHGSGGDIVVVPQINLNWQHEFMQNPYDISGNLGGTSPTFSNWSAAPIRDFLYTGVGFTAEFGKRWNTSFFYNAAAGNNNLTSQNIFWSAGVKF